MMDAQQLLDNIIVPTLEYMGAGYNSKNAQMLLLSTAAIESNCGYYIKQINGPALGIWQMEPVTHNDIRTNCDAIRGKVLGHRIAALTMSPDNSATSDLMVSPMYACAMARLKYSMDSAPLPNCDDLCDLFDYYKRIYNTHLGASTLEKFESSFIECGLDKVKFS